MRAEFPALDYVMFLVRLMRLLVVRVPAMVVALCLLLPMTQPQADMSGKVKYVVTQFDVEQDDTSEALPPAPVPVGTNAFALQDRPGLVPQVSNSTVDRLRWRASQPPARAPPLLLA